MPSARVKSAARVNPALAGEPAHREAHILDHMLQCRAESRFADVDPGRLEAAQGYERLPARLGRGNTLRTPCFGLEGDVVPQFVVQLAVDPIPAEERQQSDPPRIHPLLKRHDPLPLPLDPPPACRFP